MTSACVAAGAPGLPCDFRAALRTALLGAAIEALAWSRAPHWKRRRA